MIPFNYHHLYYFYTVANEGSISKATKVLKLAQPTLSSQLKQFEDYLGFALFIRDGKRLILTPKGSSILAYAKGIFDLGNEMMDSIHDASKKGYLKIQIGVSNWVPKSIVNHVLNSILSSSPNTYLNIVEKSLDQMLEDLRAHKLDMVLNDLPFRSSPDEGFSNRILYKIPVVFCADAKLAKKIKKIPEDLNGAPIYLPTAQSQTYYALEDYFLNHDVKPNVLGEIQDVELVRRLVLSGRGIAPINKYTVLNAPATQKLVILNPGKETGLSESVYLITKKRKNPHPIAGTIANLAAAQQHQLV